MLSKKINKITNSLLKSKTKTKKTSKTSKTSKTKLRYPSKTKTKTKTKNKKKQHLIDKFCKIYKNDINGKPNKKLYNSCKINKYCRKYKCQDIDSKILKAKQKHIGYDYNKIIFDKIKASCPQNIIKEDDPKLMKKQNQCVNKTIKKIFKDNNLNDIYIKSVECDKVTCAKEKKIFNTNLFRQKQIKLNKTHKKKNTSKYTTKIDFENEVDHDLIIKGDL